MYVRSKSGIWLPQTDTKNPPRRILLAPIVTFITLEELLGTNMSPGAFKSAMARFDGYQLLYFATKVGLVLTNDGETNAQLQVRLAEEFLSDPLFKQFDKLQKEQMVSNNRAGYLSSTRPLFTSLQVLHFIKQILINHGFEGDKVIDEAIDKDSGPEAALLLLSCSSQMGPGVATKEATYLELVRNLVFRHDSPLANQLARTYAILFRITNYKRHKSVLNLQELYKSITGVPMLAYLAIGSALLTLFTKASLMNRDSISFNNPHEYFLLEWDEYFKNLKMRKSHFRKVTELVSMTVSEASTKFKSLAQQENSSFDYDLLPFLKQPLLQCPGGGLIVSYLPFLSAKFTLIGIYWQIHDAIKNDKRWGAFKRIWGLAFQDYIWEMVANSSSRIPVKERGSSSMTSFIGSEKTKNKLQISSSLTNHQRRFTSLKSLLQYFPPKPCRAKTIYLHS